MYRLATCFWVSLRTLSPQGLSIAPKYEDNLDIIIYKLYKLSYEEVLMIDPNASLTREEYINNF